LRCLASDLLVDHVVSKSGSGSLHLGDPGGDLLDALHLLVKELGLDVVAQVSVSVRGLVHVQQALVDLNTEKLLVQNNNAVEQVYIMMEIQ